VYRCDSVTRVAIKGVGAREYRCEQQ